MNLRRIPLSMSGVIAVLTRKKALEVFEAQENLARLRGCQTGTFWLVAGVRCGETVWAIHAHISGGPDEWLVFPCTDRMDLV